MTVWKIDIPITGSMTIEVHADSEAEARQLLEEREYEPDIELCVQCSGYSTHSMHFPVRFSLDLDDITAPEDLDEMTKEG